MAFFTCAVFAAIGVVASLGALGFVFLFAEANAIPMQQRQHINGLALVVLGFGAFQAIALWNAVARVVLRKIVVFLVIMFGVVCVPLWRREEFDAVYCGFLCLWLALLIDLIGLALLRPVANEKNMKEIRD